MLFAMEEIMYVIFNEENIACYLQWRKHYMLFVIDLF
jgi:hypothetical protein